MIIFALSLLAAGAVLSILTRVHGLLAVAVGVIVTAAMVTILRKLGAAPAYPLGVTIVVAAVTLQAGYGLGIVARAALGPYLRRSSSSTPSLTAADPTSAREPEQPLGRDA